MALYRMGFPVVGPANALLPSGLPIVRRLASTRFSVDSDSFEFFFRRDFRLRHIGSISREGSNMFGPGNTPLKAWRLVEAMQHGIPTVDGVLIDPFMMGHPYLLKGLECAFPGVKKWIVRGLEDDILRAGTPIQSGRSTSLVVGHHLKEIFEAVHSILTQIQNTKELTRDFLAVKQFYPNLDPHGFMLHANSVLISPLCVGTHSGTFVSQGDKIIVEIGQGLHISSDNKPVTRTILNFQGSIISGRLLPFLRCDELARMAEKVRRCFGRSGDSFNFGVEFVCNERERFPNPSLIGTQYKPVPKIEPLEFESLMKCSEILRAPYGRTVEGRVVCVSTVADCARVLSGSVVFIDTAKLGTDSDVVQALRLRHEEFCRGAAARGIAGIVITQGSGTQHLGGFLSSFKGAFVVRSQKLFDSLKFQEGQAVRIFENNGAVEYLKIDCIKNLYELQIVDFVNTHGVPRGQRHSDRAQDLSEECLCVNGAQLWIRGNPSDFSRLSNQHICHAIRFMSGFDRLVLGEKGLATEYMGYHLGIKHRFQAKLSGDLCRVEARGDWLSVEARETASISAADRQEVYTNLNPHFKALKRMGLLEYVVFDPIKSDRAVIVNNMLNDPEFTLADICIVLGYNLKLDQGHLCFVSRAINGRDAVETITVGSGEHCVRFSYSKDQAPELKELEALAALLPKLQAKMALESVRG